MAEAGLLKASENKAAERRDGNKLLRSLTSEARKIFPSKLRRSLWTYLRGSRFVFNLFAFRLGAIFFFTNALFYYYN